MCLMLFVDQPTVLKHWYGDWRLKALTPTTEPLGPSTPENRTSHFLHSGFSEPGKSFTHKLSSSYCTRIPTSVGSHTGKICGTDTTTWLNELLWFVPDHCHQQLNLVSLHLQVISILEDYAYAFNSHFKSTVCIDYNNLLQIFITTTANELSWLTGKD